MLVMKRIDHVIRQSNIALNFCGAVWILLLMMLVVSDVFMRAAFNSPILGVADIARNSVVGIACLMLPWAMASDSHIRVYMIVSNVPKNVAKILHVFAYLVGFIVFVGIFYSSYRPFIHAFTTGAFEGEGAVRVVTWPTRLLILVAAFFSAYHCLLLVLANISSKLDFRALDNSHTNIEAGAEEAK